MTSGGSDLAHLSAEEAVPVLVERYGDTLYRLGLQVCRDEADAEDLLQEVFATAFRKWDQFEGRSEATTWLYTIAVRACRRRHRRRAGQPARLESFDELLPEPGREAAVAPPESDPEADVLREEIRSTVDAAITRLPFDFRLPLLLKEIADLPVAEVAAILDVKPATVKTRLHRARLALRKDLERILPRREMPPPDHDRSICLDLLQAKQEALDRGVPFRADAELCSRCEALFSTLDLAHQACLELRRGDIPPRVRRTLEATTAS